MGLLDAVPKNPKVSDLLPLLTDLDERVGALEEYVGRNDTRITALETYAAQVIAERGKQIDDLRAEVEEHKAGASKRQAELDALRRAINQNRPATRKTPRS